MHKRMTRILSAISLLAVIPAVAFASPARVSGLNVPGDYIKDYTGIYTYVSGVGSVGNLVYVEPNNGGQSMGAVLGNLWEGRTGTWGVHLRRFHPELGQSTSGDPFTTSNFFSDPNTNGEALDIMWGRKMGSGNLGLRFNRSFFSVENAVGTNEGAGGSRNMWGLGAGYGFPMNENTDVEIAALYQGRTFDTPPVADDGGTTYEIALRAMMKAGSNLMIMPVAKIYSFDLSEVNTPPAPAAAVSTDAKLNGWEVGVAGNWTLGTDDLFVLGANFVGNKAEQTVAPNPTQSLSEQFYPNVFMALETHVNSWLTLRFGAQNALFYSVKTENLGANDPTTIKTHSFTYNMGAGVKLGSLQMDATLEPNFWNNPVANVWNNPGGQPFGRVSATYSF